MFANILFSGPCNARCPFCIGKLLGSGENDSNLSVFPLKNIDAFIEQVLEKHITEISLTGTNTDPSLYQHQEKLIAYLRAHIPGVRISLHTNGRLLLAQKDTAALYDRIALSLPSFHEKTYRLMMGVPQVPDVQNILKNISIPVKLSCIITDANKKEIPSFVEQCKTLEIKRITFRMLYQDTSSWDTYVDPKKLGWKYIRTFANNPVYDFAGVEITLWNFKHSDISCINLYSNGHISDIYLLHQQ